MSQYRRHAIGIIALLLAVGMVVFWIWPPTAGWAQQLRAACWRLGALMVVLWLAYPEVERLPAWIWATLPLLVAILAYRPRWLVIAVPLVVILAILKPKISSRR